jgi:hypothetical protein
MSFDLQEDSLVVNGQLVYFQPGLMDMYIKFFKSQGCKLQHHYLHQGKSVTLGDTFTLSVKLRHTGGLLDSIIEDYELKYLTEDYSQEKDGIRKVKLSLTNKSVFELGEIVLFVQHRPEVFSAIPDYVSIS